MSNRGQRSIIDMGLAVFYAIISSTFVLTGLTMFSVGSFPTAPLVICGLLAVVFGRLAFKRWRPAATESASHNTGATDVRQLREGEFYTRVAGTSHKNHDGTDRQKLIRQHCAPGSPLIMEREPNNSSDSNAITVYCGGVQIGFLTGEIATKFAPAVDSGALSLSGRVTEVTGGTRAKPTLGVNIVLTRTEH